VNSSEARKRYASQVRHKAGLRSERLIEALKGVAREDFLGPPPWEITRLPNLWNREFSIDLAQIYDDVLVAPDPKRNLNNGLPSALTALIEALELKEGPDSPARRNRDGVPHGAHCPLRRRNWARGRARTSIRS
jgi:protein-L-isoaspartate(D-aspartate) O-methyltransferase